MDGASLQFVAFGLVAAIVSNLNRSPVWRSIVLAVASLAFLGFLAKTTVVFVPLAGFLLLGYVGILLLESKRLRSAVAVIIVVVFAYIWLKKYTFISHRIFLQFPYSTLGLSYIFFRVMHLVIEAGGNREKRRSIGPGRYLLYTLNFTTFISGPIQRYEEFARDQFVDEPIKLGPRVIGAQLERIIRGFFKVNVLALVLHAVQQDELAHLLQPSPLSLRLVAAFELAVVYPFFLYANFSGYIDIVIALARLMRVRLPENFDRPFSASSFIDLWNRWHITLSSWLKTYVYNPLIVALMRRISSLTWEPFLSVICSFVTFFLIGVWHGRTSEFVVYGIILGTGVSINKLWQVGLTRALGRKGYKALAGKMWYVALGRGLTFSWFAFSLFWLWANWKEIRAVFGSLSQFQWLQVWLAIWLIATTTLAIWEWLRSLVLSIRSVEGPVVSSRYVRVVFATGLGLVAIAVTMLLNQAAPDIVYKGF